MDKKITTMNPYNKIKIIPLSCTVLKQGNATKDGKTFPWTLYRVEAVELPGRITRTFSSFEDWGGKINIECEVVVEEKINVKNGVEYKNYTISSPKRNLYMELDEIRGRLEKLENARQSAELDMGNDALPEAPDKEPEEINEDLLPF